MQKRFKLLHDQMETPLERAVFWTEYVIRHKGAEHLQLASRELTSYQRSLIDVYFVLFFSALLPLLLTCFCLKKCCKRRGKLTSSAVDKKNQSLYSYYFRKLKRNDFPPFCPNSSTRGL